MLANIAIEVLGAKIMPFLDMKTLIAMSYVNNFFYNILKKYCKKYYNIGIKTTKISSRITMKRIRFPPGMCRHPIIFIRVSMGNFASVHAIDELKHYRGIPIYCIRKGALSSYNLLPIKTEYIADLFENERGWYHTKTDCFYKTYCAYTDKIQQLLNSIEEYTVENFKMFQLPDKFAFYTIVDSHRDLSRKISKVTHDFNYGDKPISPTHCSRDKEYYFNKYKAGEKYSQMNKSKTILMVSTDHEDYKGLRCCHGNGYYSKKIYRCCESRYSYIWPDMSRISNIDRIVNTYFAKTYKNKYSILKETNIKHRSGNFFCGCYKCFKQHWNIKELLKKLN